MTKAHGDARSQDLLHVREGIIDIAEQQLGLDVDGKRRRFDPPIPPKGKPSEHRGISQIAMAELLVPYRHFEVFKADPASCVHLSFNHARYADVFSAYERLIDDTRDDHLEIDIDDLPACLYKDPLAACQSGNAFDGGFLESDLVVAVSLYALSSSSTTHMSIDTSTSSPGLAVCSEGHAGGSENEANACQEEPRQYMQ